MSLCTKPISNNTTENGNLAVTDWSNKSVKSTNKIFLKMKNLPLCFDGVDHLTYVQAFYGIIKFSKLIFAKKGIQDVSKGTLTMVISSLLHRGSLKP